jgi:hypothetical protein
VGRVHRRALRRVPYPGRRGPAVRTILCRTRGGAGFFCYPFGVSSPRTHHIVDVANTDDGQVRDVKAALEAGSATQLRVVWDARGAADR